MIQAKKRPVFNYEHSAFYAFINQIIFIDRLIG